MVYVFDNMQMISSIMFPTPYKNSASKLFIGNNGSLRHFCGMIDEISISSGATSTQEISMKWNKINNWLQNNTK